MIAIVEYTANDTPITPRTAVGSLIRTPTLPIELGGVSVTINGVACGLRSVGGRRIEFVVPPAISRTTTPTVLPITINNNGALLRSFVTIVPTRPDIFRRDGVIGPGGRARAFNATNTILLTEPFAVRTVRRRGDLLVPSVIRVYLTGVENATLGVLTLRIRDAAIVGANVRTNTVLVEPGIYYVDFDLPTQLFHAGDVPIVVSVTVNGVSFDSRSLFSPSAPTCAGRTNRERAWETRGPAWMSWFSPAQVRASGNTPISFGTGRATATVIPVTIIPFHPTNRVHLTVPLFHARASPAIALTVLLRATIKNESIRTGSLTRTRRGLFARKTLPIKRLGNFTCDTRMAEPCLGGLVLLTPMIA